MSACKHFSMTEVFNGMDGTDLSNVDDMKERSEMCSKSKIACKDGLPEPHAAPTIMKWLQLNYELADGVCIPRSTLYVHYMDYCEKTDTNPMNAASFGKIIRHQFPQLTTRRLGTRGQSKYHYYGIAVKESSDYYEESYSTKAAESTSNEMTRKEHPRQTVAYSPRSKLGTLLPAFPVVKDIKLSGNISESKVSTFLMMYRTHCQRILDTVIRANFDEVESYLLYFWQGMPTHMLCILDSQTVADIVGLCDSILYKAIAGVLMPSVTQTLPESLAQVIQSFAQRLEEWLHVALERLPDTLSNAKFQMARHFSQLLERQTSLNHLCQALKGVIQSGDITSQMADDWSMVDVKTIASQTMYAVQDMGPAPRLSKLCEEFQDLLDSQSSLEAYTNWLDTQLTRCVEKQPQQGEGSSSVCQRSRRFVLTWSCFSTKVMRDMTLHSSPSFGSFHLLHMTLDEYVHYRLETILNQDRADRLLRRLKGESDESYDTNDILPSSIARGLIHRTPLRRRSQHHFCESMMHNISPDSTSPASANCDLQPVCPGQSQMTSGYMTCMESHDPVHIPSGHPACPDGEFAGCSPCPSIYSSGNSAFSPVTHNSYANYERSLLSQSVPHTSHQQPYDPRSVFSSGGFNGNGVYGNEKQVATMSSNYRDTVLAASQGKLDSQPGPAETGYGQFRLVPSMTNDAFTEGRRTMQELRSLSNYGRVDFPHLDHYHCHYDPSATGSSTGDYGLCSEIEATASYGKKISSSMEIVEGDLYIDETERQDGGTQMHHTEPFQHIQAVN